MRICVEWILTLALVAAPLVSSSGQNEQKPKYLRFAVVPSHLDLKAGEFSELPKEMKEGYAMGLLNGIFLSGLFGADGEIVKSFADCVKDMDAPQITAIIEKHVKDHPEVWHQGLSTESLGAMISACPQVQSLLKK